MKEKQDKPADAVAPSTDSTSSPRKNSVQDLRRRAEERLKTRESTPQFTIRDPQSKARIVHELQVHQLELEMQNEELKASRAEVAAGFARYTDLYESAPTGYLALDREGAILQVNLTGARLLGVERSRLVNRRFGQFVAEGDRRAFSEFLGKVFASEAKECCEVTLRQDGAPLLVVRIEAVRSADRRECRAVMLDITERKQSEEALRKSEKFIENILFSIDEAIVVVDCEYRILTANRAYCEQANMSLADITGKHCYEILHHATQPCYELETDCACKRTFETGKLAVCVHDHTDSKGKQRQVEIKTYAMKDTSGEIKSVIEVINDITEKTALEKQFLQAQKMESIGTLAGGIAHDFNNILSAIIGYGHIALMKMAEDDPQRLNINGMLEGADRATYLTKSLLLFSRKQMAERRAVDLNDVVRKVEKFLGRVIGEDIERKILLSDNAIPILADSNQLEQVLMNLAINARDAMPKGGTFTLKTEQLELAEDFTRAHGYGKPGSYAMMTISDSGTGMDEATREHIFEPFFTTKEVGKGTGLGLAVVYGIIKDHDGFINVYSEPGKGTTFRIYLPIIGEVAAKEATAQHREAPARGTETVLVAEDDEKLIKLSRLVLTEYGYTVIEAVDGEDAVKKFRDHKDTIQLLLFDLIMPKMNGKEAFDEIRKIKPDVKVLFTSGYDPNIVQQKTLLEAGINLVYKPISPMDLLRKVRSVLDGATQ